MKKSRNHIPEKIKTHVLTRSKRRCCLCYFLSDNKVPMRGQLSHINHNPNDNRIDNLVFLCLSHHDEYDSKTSQSKGFTEHEIKYYKNKLYKTLETNLLEYPTISNEISQIPKSNNASHRLKELQFLDNPWKLLELKKDAPELFAYKSPNHWDGICRIQRFDLDNDKVLFICEDIEDNPGISTTNNIEFVALQLCESFDVEPNDFILIEHYYVSFHNKDEWNMVEFEEKNLHKGFINPSWKTMGQNDWNLLGYRPRRKRSQSIINNSLLIPIKK